MTMEADLFKKHPYAIDIVQYQLLSLKRFRSQTLAAILLSIISILAKLVLAMINQKSGALQDYA